jgi:hypothetical protein
LIFKIFFTGTTRHTYDNRIVKIKCGCAYFSLDVNTPNTILVAKSSSKYPASAVTVLIMPSPVGASINTTGNRVQPINTNARAR